MKCQEINFLFKMDGSTCMLVNISCFCCRLLNFFKINFFKIYFQEHYQGVNGLDPDHDKRSVGLDLGPNCLQKLLAAMIVLVRLNIRPFQHHGISRNQFFFGINGLII